jgi:hypothetical protein
METHAYHSEVRMVCFGSQSQSTGRARHILLVGINQNILMVCFGLHIQSAGRARHIVLLASAKTYRAAMRFDRMQFEICWP